MKFKHYFSIIFMLIQVLYACPKVLNLDYVPEFINGQSKIAVTLLNQSINDRVLKSIKSFKIPIVNLANNSITKDSLAAWYLNLSEMNQIAFDEIEKFGVIKDKGEITRLAHALVQGFVSGWIEAAFSVVAHEYAHYEVGVKQDMQQLQFRSDTNRHLSLGEVFLTALKGKRAFTNTDYNSLGGVAIDSFKSMFRKSAVESAAGINLQTNYAEAIALKSVEKGKFHQADFAAYLANKFNMTRYVIVDPSSRSSDIAHYISSQTGLGNVTYIQQEKIKKELANLSMATSLLSGRFIEGINSTFQYVKSGDPELKTLKFSTPYGDVTWPELSTYLNMQSVSVKAMSSIDQKHKKAIDISLEQTVLGSNITEVSAQLHFVAKKIDTSVTGIANTNNRYGIKTQVAYETGHRGWFVYGGGSVDNGTLDGNREFLSSDENTVNAKVYVGIEVRH